MMARRYFLLFSFIIAVSCDELTIVSSPKALEFRGSSDLESDSLSDVFAASIGYSVIHRTSWDGLVVRDPFNTPNGVVAIVAEGLDKLDYQDGHTYPLSGHSASASIDDFLQSVGEHDNAAMDVNLKNIGESQQTILGELAASNEQPAVHYLKPKGNKEDADFLKQISYINSLAELITSSSDLPSAIVTRMSFDALVASHSKSSAAVKEAKKILFKALDNLQTAAEKAYKGSVLVSVIATNGDFIRSKRQAEPTPADDGDNPLNLAPIYSTNYPVIFNIILWFSVILTFSLLAISIAICTMDPGRDSIIYRMTSTRMKKDN